MKHNLVKNCDWPFKTEQIIIKLAVTDDELVQRYRLRSCDTGCVILILIVVEDGLVLNVSPLYSLSMPCLNPCYSGR